MSNPYFTFSPRFIPGTKVRAQAVNTQFDLLEDAFDLLPASGAAIVLGTATLGVESGSANAYVVTMPNTRLANADGDEVVFKATHQNSGASTLQVDSISAAPLVRWDGTALSSGDILVNSYYTARYDATNIRFLIVAPAQSTVAGAISYAAPSGKVKLAASAGTVSTLIRSDADIALDVTISPTWSGSHTFSNRVLGAAGTAGAPTWSFSGDPNTGEYSVGADDWGVSTGGTLRFDISTTAITSTLPFRGPTGGANAPAYSFSSDTDTGMLSGGANLLSFSVGGTTLSQHQLILAGNARHVMMGGDNTSSTTALTVTDTPNIVTQFTIRGDGQVQHRDGTAAAPSFSFLSDTDTGAYSVGANDWGVATSGTLRFDISTTAVTSTLVFGGPAGAAGTPTWSFSGDPNTGAYSVGADDWGVSTGGTLRFDISTTAITSTLPITATGLTLGSTSPIMGLFDSDGGTNTKRTLIEGNADLFFMWFTEDTPSSTKLFFQASRTAGTAAVANVSLGNATDNPTLSFLGTGVVTSGGVARGPNGALAGPTWSFSNDPDTGIMSNGANSALLVAGANIILSWTWSGSVGLIGLPSITSSSSATAGGASALPATPQGYITIGINGTDRKIPYYV